MQLIKDRVRSWCYRSCVIFYPNALLFYKAQQALLESKVKWAFSISHNHTALTFTLLVDKKGALLDASLIVIRVLWSVSQPFLKEHVHVEFLSNDGLWSGIQPLLVFEACTCTVRAVTHDGARMWSANIVMRKSAVGYSNKLQVHHHHNIVIILTAPTIGQLDYPNLNITLLQYLWNTFDAWGCAKQHYIACNLKVVTVVIKEYQNS